MNQDKSTAVSLGMMAMGLPPAGGMPASMGGIPSMSSSAGPSSAAGYFGSTQSGFDNSGWTISFGGSASAATGDRGGLTQTPTPTTGIGAFGGTGLGMAPVLLGVAVLAILLLRKHGKR